MKLFLLPVVTALLSSVIGPVMAMFPFTLFPVFGFAAIVLGFIPASIGGFVLGTIFLCIPDDKMLKLLNMNNWKRILIIALLGGTSGAIGSIILGAFENDFHFLFLSDIYAWHITINAGALSSFVLWEVVVKRFYLQRFNITQV